jgi:hypothetical protein
MAASHPECPRDTAAPSLRTDRETCGIAEASFDHTIEESSSDGHGSFHIPGAQQMVAILDDALKTMLAPLSLVAGGSKEARALHEEYRERLNRLVNARPPLIDDMMSGETIASMRSGGRTSGDGLHILIMDLHKELNRLQSEISTEEIEGAKAYGIVEADRFLVAAFMKGVNRTAPLKFEHPGLATTAARSGDALLIQNDLGTTEAHVLVVRVTETTTVLTHIDIHLQRLRFFQSLLSETGIEWDDLTSHQTSAIPEGDLFYVARGRVSAQETKAFASSWSVWGLAWPSLSIGTAHASD